VSSTFAVFGGSFDPPHVAHTLLAAYALAAHPIERVLVVPTFAHAFGKPLAPFDDRVRMCELAFGDLRRVEVSSIERELPTPSLTLHTLEALAQRHPGAQLRLLIGSDLLAETHAWHNFERIQKLAPVLVVQRQGHLQPNVDQPALPDVSSSEIRRRLQAAKPTVGLLCPAVELYARTHRLYAAS
jgi:nicotinate-nucleotide adenylyltransferase